jgi:hypothetical protein
VSVPSAQGLYPAEHRGLRELYATARQLASHWDRLGGRLGGTPGEALATGANAARELLRELEERTAAHGLHGYPAAQGVGGRLAGLRNVAGDLVLERNQALRAAVLDVAHVATLLAWLSALADRRGDAALAAWHRRWEARMRDEQERAMAAVLALAEDPGAAIEPASDGVLGRAGHGVASGLGTLGEAIDASAVGRAARKARRQCRERLSLSRTSTSGGGSTSRCQPRGVIANAPPFSRRTSSVRPLAAVVASGASLSGQTP